MDAIVRRTALLQVSETGDCFPMIANKEGKMVVGQFGSFIYGFTEAYDEEIEEGISFSQMILICAMLPYLTYPTGCSVSCVP